MNLGRQLLFAGGLILLMLAVSAWAWGSLPDRVAVHFGAGGAANGWAPKLKAVLIMPAVAAALSLVFAFLYRFTPARAGPQRSPRAYLAIWTDVLVLMAAMHALILAKALDPALPVPRIVAILVGGLLMLIGNYAGKIRHNFVFGLRTPWTLADERVWDRTHRLYGPLQMLGGAGLFVAAVALPDPRTLIGAVMIAGIAPGLLATLYSMAISDGTRSRA